MPVIETKHHDAKDFEHYEITGNESLAADLCMLIHWEHIIADGDRLIISTPPTRELLIRMCRVGRAAIMRELNDAKFRESQEKRELTDKIDSLEEELDNLKRRQARKEAKTTPQPETAPDAN